MKLARILRLALIAVVSGKGVGGLNILAEQMPNDLSGTVNTSFALSLYARLSHNPGNLFFSPYSISTCLSMACEGARGNTEKQMLSVLDPGTNQSGAFHSFFGQHLSPSQCELNIANGLWSQSGYRLLPTFIEIATRRYDAELRQRDFITQAELATDEINRWVAEKTKGKIQDILPSWSLDGNTRMVLANAIYFKGTWATKFDSNSTTLQPFSVSLANKVDVQLMGHLAKVPYVGNETFQALELPYSGKALSMLIFLPRKVDGLDQLEGWLNPVFLARWLGQMKPQEVEIHFPRFKLKSSFDLSGELARMGMPDAFSVQSADFSGIDGTHNLFIRSVFHKAWIDVAEEGTEAAAATAIGVFTRSSAEPPPRPPIFRADHPFIFLIRENSSGRVLFLGRVKDPTK